MYVPAEKVVENVLTTYFFNNFRLIIQFKTARKLKEGNIKRLQKYKVSEKQVFSLSRLLYLLNCFLFTCIYRSVIPSISYQNFKF